MADPGIADGVVGIPKLDGAGLELFPSADSYTIALSTAACTPVTIQGVARRAVITAIFNEFNCIFDSYC
ncbi:hypothetical protein EVA_09034 [gut metagenome]|uniref:Uncharacterized protein n=1 Tax=gut metagenome TaxID=749906 RepID=J9GRR6_9ZZZZ